MDNSRPWRDLVWAADLGPVEKLVALCIAEHANRLGECFPGQRRIARLTGFSEKTVSRALQKLDPILEFHNVPKRGRPGKTAMFRFRQKETDSPFIKQTSSPFMPEKNGRSGREKETRGAEKIDSQSMHLIKPFLEPIKEPATSKLSATETEIWKAFIDSVRNDIPSPAYFEQWFESLVPIAIGPDRLEILANKLTADWISRNYAELTATALKAAGIPDAKITWRPND
ncbi:MAG: helix-turn-helix domain-containing protein [Acidobacteria bacterium]|nr:helix-turn-helix domain-containing protein [Acidobacteriota bacterium]